MADPDTLSARLATLEADNARLRRLLDERGTNEALRHGLRDTLAVLRVVMRQSAETAETVEGYVAHLEGRFDAIIRARSVADALGEVDLHHIVSDALLIHVVHEGEQATLGGPRVRLRPKAAQVLALALHELASNAVEHGSLTHAHGRLGVMWRSEDEDARSHPWLVIHWRESNGSTRVTPSRRGFGSTVIEKMLPYELGGQAVLTFEPAGLSCLIRFALTDRVGRILPDSRDDEVF